MNTMNKTMNKILQHSSLTVVGLSLGLLALSATSAHGAIVGYAFDVEIDFGALDGQTFSGNFSYGDDGLTGVGEEVLALDSFSFTFDGSTLGLEDLAISDVAFFDGTFLGLDAMDHGEALSFIPGFEDTSDALFTYGDAGAGNVFYTPTPTGSEPVPEPLTILGSLAAIGIGTTLKKKTSQT
jgi:hypothetical protein